MADPSTNTEMVRVPILGENGRISDDYVPQEIPDSVDAVTQKATEAAQSASNASASASAASRSANAAATSETNAAGSAKTASDAATTATEQATAANGHADIAKSYSDSASQSALAASGYVTDAAQSATAAADRASAAQTSATQAAGSASDAASSATAAQSSASQAATSVTVASGHADAAAGSAAAASSSASAAASSASDASNSATVASNSATAAANSAKIATDKADSVMDHYITSATAATLEPDQPATAEVVDNVLNLGIPKGDKGDKGDTGIGVPEGGEPGQLLSKTDDGTAWVDPPSGNVLVGTATGPVAHAEDAYAAKPREVRIEGRTVNNLWLVVGGTQDGLTFATDETGLIIVSGTATASGHIRARVSGLAENKDVSAVKSGGTMDVSLQAWNAGSYVRDVMKVNTSASTANTGTGFDTIYARINYTNGETYNASFRVMLVEGTKAPDCFTPTGIHGVGPEKLVTAGKNLVNLDGAEYVKSSSSSSSSSATFGADGSVTITGATDSWNGCYVELKSVVLPPGAYVASGFSNGKMLLLLTSPNVLNPEASGDYYTKAGYPFIVSVSAGKSSAFKIDAPSRVAFSTGDQIADGASLTLYPQIEVGSTATSYEPPTVTEVTLPETDPLMSINGKDDVLSIAQDGSVSVERHVERGDITEETLATGMFYPTSGDNPPYFACNLDITPYASADDFTEDGASSSSSSSSSSRYVFTGSSKDAPEGVTRGVYRTWNSVIFWDEEFTGTEQARQLILSGGGSVWAQVPESVDQLGTVQLPQLPAPTFNAYPTGGYVPGDTSVGYERDVNLTINNMQEVIDGLVGGGQ